jgi:DNA-binding transcriptional regulator YdaS (Cro superfamily)
MNAPPFTILLIAVSLFSNWAGAQKIYQCGSSYSQTPCPDARILPINDARSAAQQQQTRDASRRDQLLADQLEKTRLEQEKMSARPVSAAKLASIHRARSGPVTPTRPKARAASQPLAISIAKLAKKPQQFVAEVPGSAASTGKQKKPSATKSADE